MSHQFIGTVQSYQNTHDGKVSGVYFKEYNGRVPVSKYESTEVPKIEAGHTYYVTVNDKGWIYKMTKMESEKKVSILDNVNKYDRDRTIARQACLNYAINASSHDIVPKPKDIDELLALAEMFVSWVYGEAEPDDTELPAPVVANTQTEQLPVANIIAHNGDACCKTCYWTHNNAKWRNAECACACHAAKPASSQPADQKVTGATESSPQTVTPETGNVLPHGLIVVAR